ncbi:MAG: glycosyltransferase family 9 protein [Acidobacteria bacterium]|nr:glycosyltransferase family 9 protein [Acidobacteriota bacterium]MCA1620723.1 glycosyltransferase family 9 protein [Acidobacteriota bacterium]
MKSLRRQTEPGVFRPAPAADAADAGPADDGAPLALAPARWDWSRVERVLVVRLRSIGDTVLATPSLRALRRFLPGARIDVLLEDWVAPLLEGSPEVDRVLTVRRKSQSSRLAAARRLRAAGYDVAYNLHGGSTAALLVRASGARHRVGYADYAYASLHNHAAPPSSELWGREKTHSAEQQLALLGWTGVPVTDRPASRLAVLPEAAETVARRLREEAGLADGQPFALVHPAAAFETKTWAAENFARVVEHLAARGLPVVAVAAPGEASVIEEVRARSASALAGFTDLTLPELTALAARSALFVGNDSGVAHVAAAVGAPQVVVFGSSNVAHWRPWTEAPAEVVREEMPCAPCPGYTCAEFGSPECIRRVPVARVVAAVERVLAAAAG